MSIGFEGCKALGHTVVMKPLLNETDLGLVGRRSSTSNSPASKPRFQFTKQPTHIEKPLEPGFAGIRIHHPVRPYIPPFTPPHPARASSPIETAPRSLSTHL